MRRFTWALLGLSLIMVLSMFQGNALSATPSEGSLDELRKELNQLKIDYATRIMQLEARMAALEKNDSTMFAKGNPSAGVGDGSLAPSAVDSEAMVVNLKATPASGETSVPRGWLQPKVTGKISNATASKDSRNVFEYQGYLRSGFGVNSKGGDMEPFKAPGAEAKYRLGNEGETYGEAALIHNYLNTDGPTFKTQIRIGYQTKNHMDWDVDNDKFMLREAYTEMGNFTWAPSVKFWAGERFYRRHDIHINDFYVFDMSGYGGGAEDIPVGNWGKLAAAWIGGSTDDYEFPTVGRVAKNTLDLRLYDIDLPWGKGMFWLAPSYLAGGSYANSNGTTVNYDDTAGLAVGFMHTNDKPFGLDNSYNQFTLQYGRGTGSNFSPVVQDPTVNLGDSWKFRLTESGVFQVADNFSLMPTFIWQMEDLGYPGDSQITWVSAGVRPIYNFTEHISLAVEGGVDYVDNEPLGVRDYLFKGTIAPQLSFGELFFSRPVLRLYATYAKWGSGFEGRVGGAPYADATSGANFGIQMEAWW